MQIPKALTPTAILLSSVTLLLGAGGGWLFDQWRMPLAWLVGAMVVTTTAALVGAPLKGSLRLRNIMIPILGVMLGSAFTPVALAGVGGWIPSLSALIAFIVVVMVCVGLYFHRVVGFGPVTSYFSATPGGLATMVLIGVDMGGDERNISLVHSIRILLTVLVIPFWFRLFEGYQPGGIAALGSVSELVPVDGVILFVCAVAGISLARVLKVPSPLLLGPMIASAVAHLAGVTAAKPPVEIVNLAQLVIGTSIGTRFVGISVV
ncbi:MAG: AbrB family transcriptional regulator, partial [Pseudomonadota bacterium]|nr:AbrB family transcriptional regulator [Pseudomonadota bacterium]